MVWRYRTICCAINGMSRCQKVTNLVNDSGADNFDAKRELRCNSLKPSTSSFYVGPFKTQVLVGPRTDGKILGGEISTCLMEFGWHAWRNKTLKFGLFVEVGPKETMHVASTFHFCDSCSSVQNVVRPGRAFVS